MRSTAPEFRVEAEPVLMPELTEAEKKERLAAAIEKRDKLAESRVEMAKWFLQSGKKEIGKRRLQEIVSEFAASDAAEEAIQLLKGL